MTEPRRKYYVWQWGEYPELKSGSIRKAGGEGASLAQIAVDAGLNKPQTRKALAGLLVHPRSCLVVLNLDDDEANIDFAVERIRLHLHFGDLHACESTLNWMSQKIGEDEEAAESKKRILKALALSLRRRRFMALSAYHSEEENTRIASLAADWINDKLEEHDFEFEARINQKRDYELEMFLGPDVIDLSAYRHFRNQLLIGDAAIR